jgi:S1-C subfamily serine protease
VITAINGDTVGRPADLRRNVQRLSSGDEFTLMVVRDKKPLTLKGKVEDRRDRRRTYRS